MADFNRDYNPTEWGGDNPPDMSPANLNNIEAFIVELDDRTKDLKADKLDKSSDFARRAEEAEEQAETAKASAEAAASRAEEAASRFSVVVTPSYSEGDVLATVSVGGETTTIYGNVKASDVTALSGNVQTLSDNLGTLSGTVSSLSGAVDDLSALVGQANAILEGV